MKLQVGSAMPTAEYYRHQAQLCARLATFADDPLQAERYQVLALELLLKADRLEFGTTGPDTSRPDLDQGRDSH